MEGVCFMSISQSPKSGQQFEDKFSRNLVAFWLNRMGENGMAERFFNCGEGGRGFVGVCPDGHQVYHAFGCESRLCERCSARRARVMADEFVPAVQRLVAAAPAHLGLRHIVLGTDVSMLEYMRVHGAVNGSMGSLDRHSLDGLREVIKLYRGFLVDMLRELWGGNKQCGWAIGVEFGMKGLMLHFHVLALSPYIAQRELSDLWKKASLGRGGYIWIEAVGRDDVAITKSVKYVAKYVTKPLGKINGDDGKMSSSANALKVVRFIENHGIECVIAALAYTFKGLRRFQEYGSLYSMERSVEPPECCQVCGKGLIWLDERTFLDSPIWSGLLNSSKTNKFVVDGDESPDPPPINVKLSGF